MPNIREVIQNAIGESATVSIVYNGGSRPGASRTVIPVSITTDELIAREPGERVVKHFKLDKIASASLSTGETATNTDVVSVPIRIAPNFNSFKEYAAFFRENLKESGVNIIESENYFAIAGFFKNGKPRKTPMTSIQFIDRSTETVFNFDSGELEEIKHDITGRERPWRVDSTRFKEGKALGQLSKAAELFLQEAHALKGTANAA